jgi:HEAT repeat protein
VEPLLERLGHPEPEVAERAVGALAEIGDRRAVGPLIDFAHRRGRGLDQYARIVGDLGGPEARAWLETLAVGHPDVGVREAAAESLATLARHEARTRAAAR